MQIPPSQYRGAGSHVDETEVSKLYNLINPARHTSTPDSRVHQTQAGRQRAAPNETTVAGETLHDLSHWHDDVPHAATFPDLEQLHADAQLGLLPLLIDQRIPKNGRASDEQASEASRRQAGHIRQQWSGISQAALQRTTPAIAHDKLERPPSPRYSTLTSWVQNTSPRTLANGGTFDSTPVDQQQLWPTLDESGDPYLLDQFNAAYSSAPVLDGYYAPLPSSVAAGSTSIPAEWHEYRDTHTQVQPMRPDVVFGSFMQPDPSMYQSTSHQAAETLLPLAPDSSHFAPHVPRQTHEALREEQPYYNKSPLAASQALRPPPTVVDSPRGLSTPLAKTAFSHLQARDSPWTPVSSKASSSISPQSESIDSPSPFDPDAPQVNVPGFSRAILERTAGKVPDVMPGKTVDFEELVSRLAQARLEDDEDGLIDKSRSAKKTTATAGPRTDSSSQQSTEAMSSVFASAAAAAASSSAAASDTGSPAEGEIKRVSKNGKTAMELSTHCTQCKRLVALLTLRGSDDEFNDSFYCDYVCYECSEANGELRPVVASGSGSGSGDGKTTNAGTNGGGGNGSSSDVFDDPVSYLGTISAAVDRAAGDSMTADDPKQAQYGRRPPPTRLATVNTHRKRTLAQKEILACVCCTRIIATGETRTYARDSAATFGVEALCPPCNEKYRRCSDCGGSAGPKLGVGKFRCKEMFAEGRKTCRLSHLRLAPSQEIVHDVWLTSDIPEAEREEFETALRREFANALYRALAVPETLEAAGTSVLRTYEQVRRTVKDSWKMYEPLLRDDIEGSHGTRKYVGIQWARVVPRKKKATGRNSTAAGSDLAPRQHASDEILTEDEGSARQLMRPGRTLAGYHIAELDLPFGSVFLSLAVPTGPGARDMFPSTSKLLCETFRRMADDVRVINAMRAAQSLPIYPIPYEMWFINLWRRDLRSWYRRGFMHIEDYLKEYPDAVSTHFSPFRPVFLPLALLGGWVVYVRRVRSPEDLLVPTTAKHPVRGFHEAT